MMRDAPSALADTAMLLGVAVLAVSAVADLVDSYSASAMYACGGDVDEAPRRAHVDCPGGAAFGRVTLGEVLILGATPADLCARVEHRLPALAACAELSLLGGRVTIRASLAADGDVAPHNSTGFDADVARCMADVVAGLDVAVFDQPGLITLEVDVRPRRAVTVVAAGEVDVGGRSPSARVLVAP